MGAVLLGALALATSGCAWIVAATADPGNGSSPLQVVAPTNRSQVPAAGTVPVDVRIGSAVVPGSVKVTLVTGTDLGHATDITNRLTIAAGHATGTLGAGDLRAGFGVVTAQGTLTAGGTTKVESVFSWEPAIDTSVGGCEFLGQSRCLLPFPNDFFTVADATTDTGRRVDFEPGIMPANKDGVKVDPTEWDRNDGFSPGSAIVLQVPGVDLAQTGAAPITNIAASLAPNAPIVLLDATTGERWPYFAELDAWATTDAGRAFFVRPARNFPEGHRIVVGLRNLRDAAGHIIPASRAFTVYRDEVPTFDAAIEQRRPHFNDRVFKPLTAAGVARKSLYLAWDFTIASERNLSERVLKMRDDAFATIGNGAPSFTVSTVIDNVSSTIFRRVTGTFSVPLFLTGTGAPGSRINYGPNGLPAQNGTFNANYICNIPRSVYSGSGAVSPGRALVYGHGLLGFAGEVNSFGGLANTHKIVMCATDWIGMSTNDLGNIAAILANLSNFPTLPDRVQQAFVNFQFLARLMKSPNGFVTNAAFRVGGTPSPAIASGAVFYNGNSQGGILGGGATAVSTEWTRAALGVPGMNFSTLLNRSTQWDNYFPLLAQAYTDELDRSIGYSVIQMLWDRSEANGYAQHLTTDPLPGTPPHQVLLIEAFGDHQVANIATETEARTIGASVHTPALAAGRSTDVAPMWGIPAVPSDPFGGSVLVIWDYGTPAPPTQNLPPRSPQYGSDPHGAGAGEPRVGQEVANFLQTNGFFTDLCNGGPCQSP